jgi:hypothetical protein
LITQAFSPNLCRHSIWEHLRHLLAVFKPLLGHFLVFENACVFCFSKGNFNTKNFRR